MNGCPNRKSFIPGPTSVLPSLTRGGSRMRESRTYGSVRGALSNERPYRDRCARNDEENGQLVRSDREAVARCMATNSAAWNCGSGVRHGDITQYLTVERLPCW